MKLDKFIKSNAPAIVEDGKVFANPQVHSVYAWCVRYQDGEWSRLAQFKTREEAEKFVKELKK